MTPPGLKDRTGAAGSRGLEKAWLRKVDCGGLLEAQEDSPAAPGTSPHPQHRPQEHNAVSSCPRYNIWSVPHDAAKAIALGCNVFQIAKLLVSSPLLVSELALPVTFPIKCSKYASKDSDCHSLSHQQENALEDITAVTQMDRQKGEPGLRSVRNVIALSRKGTGATTIKLSWIFIPLHMRIWSCKLLELVFQPTPYVPTHKPLSANKDSLHH